MSGPVTHNLVEALRGVPDFSSLEDDTLLQIVGTSVNLAWSAGSTVFDEDEPAEALYVVLAGRARIVDHTSGGEDEVAIIEPGDYFGEQALLGQGTHSKSAHTLEDSEFMVIPADSFRELLADDPDLAEQVERTRSKRRIERSEPVD